MAATDPTRPPAPARGPHRIHSASAHRRAAGPAAAALSRDRERLAGGAGGGNQRPRLAGTRPAKSAARMAAPAMAIDLALFRWLVPPDLDP